MVFDVFLGLGSNLSFEGKDSLKILETAVVSLKTILSGSVVSSFYETEPFGVADQNFFINCAVRGGYTKTPETLLEEIHLVEASFGRNRKIERRWGERTLDIDILLFGNMVINNDPLLIVPHARLKERRFALEPLLELFPQAVEPGTGTAYRTYCDALPLSGIKKY